MDPPPDRPAAMTLRGRDELAGGDERDPVQLPPWLRTLGVLLAVAVVGWLLVRGGGDAAPKPAADRSPTATSAPTQPERVTATGFPPLEGPVLVAGTTCLTTARRSFTVTFALQNASAGRVTVLSLSAHLPVGDLQPTGGRVPAQRSCGGADIDPRRTVVLEPGDRLPVSLGFARPDGCPLAGPLQADVALIGTGETPTTQRVVVVADLASFEGSFESCQPSR